MSRKHRFDKADECRLSHEEQGNRVTVEKLLGALRRTDNQGPEVHFLPDGRNVIVVNFKVTPQLRRQGYISRKELQILTHI